jgi:dihydroneopterin aldolase
MTKQDIIIALKKATQKTVNEDGVNWKMLYDDAANEVLKIAELNQIDVAEKILRARDAFVMKDYNEVWHWLYSIASPNHDKPEPWEDLERIARLRH